MCPVRIVLKQLFVKHESYAGISWQLDVDCQHNAKPSVDKKLFAMVSSV